MRGWAGVEQPGGRQRPADKSAGYIYKARIAGYGLGVDGS